jgi:citronellol/citronellal dehydrogenase
MGDLRGRTVFITGASRGIGRAIALRAASDGANVAIVAKTARPHPTLPGTIHETADEIAAAGGAVLALEADIRFEEQVEEAVARAAEKFRGIDVLVNNASAIGLTSTLETSAKRFDLMFDVNVRGAFVSSRACIPHLRDSANPHILMLSPPLDMKPRWFAPHLAYTMSKYGMSMCVLGMAEEFRPDGIAVNALWPRTVIATEALRMLGGRVAPENCRTPAIVAEAAHAIVTRSSRSCTGNFFIDEEVLLAEGVADLSGYAVEPGAELTPDLFLE